MSQDYFLVKANDGKTYRVPTNPKWNSGPPPSVGWWPASIAEDPACLRWWNGQYWSRCAWPEISETVADSYAVMKDLGNYFEVQWCARWWE